MDKKEARWRYRAFVMYKKPSISAKLFSYFLECCLPALRFLCFLLVIIAGAWFGVTSLRQPPVENELAFGGFLANSSRTFLRSFGRTT